MYFLKESLQEFLSFLFKAPSAHPASGILSENWRIKREREKRKGGRRTLSRALLWGMGENEQEDGWTVAGAGKKNWKRRKGKTSHHQAPQKRHKTTQKYVWDPAVLDGPVEEGQVRSLSQRVRTAQEVLNSSKFCSNFRKLLQDNLAAHLAEEVVVYGLGSLENGPPACKYQFALAIILTEELARATGRTRDVLFFDPAFTAYDKRVIESYENFFVMREDEHCARTTTKPTLFYMPHCEAELYHSLLKANWRLHQLPNLVILGNSFASYKLRWGVSSQHKPFPPDYPELVSAAECACEVPVPAFNFVELSAVNDMSFHCFPRHSVSKLFQ